MSSSAAGAMTGDVPPTLELTVRRREEIANFIVEDDLRGFWGPGRALTARVEAPVAAKLRSNARVTAIWR